MTGVIVATTASVDLLHCMYWLLRLMKKPDQKNQFQMWLQPPQLTQTKATPMYMK